MSKLSATILTLTLFPVLAVAQASSREASIGQIEREYAKASQFSAGSPFVESVLARAKSANPSTTAETWEKLEPEVVSAISAAMTGPEGMLGGSLRASVSGLSDSELERLRAVLQDPVYKKFQAAMSSPEVQRQLLQATMASTMKSLANVNAVLAGHGMNEVH